jgi:hypothetical protein
MTVAVHPSRIVDIDPEIGPVRYCRHCDEWWPQDAEFWVIQVRPVGAPNSAHGRPYIVRTPCTTLACRACRRERQSARDRTRTVRDRLNAARAVVRTDPARLERSRQDWRDRYADPERREQKRRADRERARRSTTRPAGVSGTMRP